MCATVQRIRSWSCSAVAFTALVLWSTFLSAWWDGGHMQIAAIAYDKLTLEAKDRVVSRSQAALAAQRLANMLNEAFR
jgi:hypothetical protein